MDRRIEIKELYDPSSGSGKFCDPKFTLEGESRAHVDPLKLDTLWINTGSLCNLSCENCYIESTPTNDRLAFISESEVRALLNEISSESFSTKEIGFTGGEPFLNEELIPILRMCLQQGFKVLVLTNAMSTMMKHEEALLELKNNYSDSLKIRVSLDHYTEKLHAKERGKRSWKPAITGLRWLSLNNFSFNVAGRTYWGESNENMRNGYKNLFQKESISLDATSPAELILFPEMDASFDVPEITSSCWSILNKRPEDLMCSNSRMVVKQKNDTEVSIMACTLLPYDQRFNLGSTLKESWQMVSLNHPHCSKFCVLGGGSCTG